MEIDPKTFEITVGGRDVSLAIGMCAVTLFREQQEVDYIAVQLEEDTKLHIFNNVEFARWLAGYQIVEQDGVINRPVYRQPLDGFPQTFRELTGWNPAVIEKEEPSEEEMEMFLDINAGKIDQEWEAWE